MTWWETDMWAQYEAACCISLTRSQQLAAATWQTQVLDLNQPEALLWRGVRKSYHSLIHGAQGHADYAWTVVDHGKTHVNELVCRAIHGESAGRETRPPETWAMMDAWINGGHSLTVYVQGPGPRAGDHARPLGYATCVIYGDWAY